MMTPGSESTSRKLESAAPVRPRMGTAIAASGSAVAPTSQVAPPKINIIAAAISRPKAPNTMFSAPTTLTCVCMPLLGEQLRFLCQEVLVVRGALDVQEPAHPEVADPA